MQFPPFQQLILIFPPLQKLVLFSNYVYWSKIYNQNYNQNLDVLIDTGAAISTICPDRCEYLELPINKNNTTAFSTVTGQASSTIGTTQIKCGTIQSYLSCNPLSTTRYHSWLGCYSAIKRKYQRQRQDSNNRLDLWSSNLPNFQHQSS